jgi:hypothetical protein
MYVLNIYNMYIYTNSQVRDYIFKYAIFIYHLVNGCEWA